MQARAAGSGENYFGNAWSNGCVARMAISLGIKAPLDYSVFSASAAALLLALYQTRIEEKSCAAHLQTRHHLLFTAALIMTLLLLSTALILRC
jgi:hypothetical protein